MALSIVNNTASLNAQQSLNATNSALGKSLERLSTGLKINRGADGPAALVISEQQRAQIAGIQTAIDNTNKAVSVVQTAEGALNEVNGLLTQIRSLALDSANSGVNDASALAANQAEINNALSTITSIANTTKFGTKNLLDGSAGISAALTSANAAGVKAVSVDSGVAAGNYTVAINTQGKGGTTTGIAGTGTQAAAGSLTISGGGLSSSVVVGLDAGDTVATSATKIQKALDDASAQGGGAGKFSVSLAAGKITINSNILGASSTAISVVSDNAATTGAVTGFDGSAGVTSAAGADLTVTITDPNNVPTTVTATAGSAGLNNQINLGGPNGLNFSVDVTSGATAAATSATTLKVTDNSLVFQIGANANETAKIGLSNTTAASLGQGVTGLSNTATTDLSKIDVTSQAGAQDAIKVVDAAINQVSVLRGNLGAFQANTLESNARNLSTTLQNTTAAESVIRDTDFASEIANYTKLQTQVQAGATVLGNANQTTQLVAQLLRG